MHDVFISYSRRDRSRAQAVARLLQSEKITVWWDEAIPPGKDYQENIQERLDSAKCIIVLWSEDSVNSRWVRSEASVGDERGILLPVQIGPCRLPVAFRLVQTETLFNSEIDTRGQSWVRVLARVRSLMGNEDRPSVPVAGGPSNYAGPEHAELVRDQKPRSSHRSSYGAPAMVLILTWLALLTLWWHASALLMVTIVSAGAVLFFFRFAEQDINPQMRVLAASWIMPRPDGPRVSLGETLNHMFEAVFGSHHFSVKCVLRSFTISSLLVFLSLLVIVIAFGRSTELNLGVLLTAIVIVFFVNGLGDYLCLYKTRVLLRQYRAGWPVQPIVVLDAILGPTIFVAFLGVAVFVVYGIDALNEGRALAGTPLSDFWMAKYKQLLLQPYYDLRGGSSSELLPLAGRRLLYSCIATSFLTSVWIWAAAVFGPPLRLLTWFTGGSLALIAMVFDVEKAPFSALGYFAAMVVLLLGCIVGGSVEVLAALGNRAF